MYREKFWDGIKCSKSFEEYFYEILACYFQFPFQTSRETWKNIEKVCRNVVGNEWVDGLSEEFFYFGNLWWELEGTRTPKGKEMKKIRRGKQFSFLYTTQYLSAMSKGKLLVCMVLSKGMSFFLVLPFCCKPAYIHPLLRFKRDGNRRVMLTFQR